MIPEKTKDRITLKHIYHVALDVLSYEKGFIFTYKEFIAKPGKSLFDYFFTENRRRYSNPFKSILIITALSTLCFTQLGFTEVFVAGFEKGWSLAESTNSDSDLIKKGFISLFLDYPTLFALLWIPINSVFSLLFFRKSKLYFAEYIVLNTYLLCIQNIMVILFAFLAYLTSEELIITVVPFAFFMQYYIYFEFYNIKMKVKQTFLKTSVLIILSIPLYAFLATSVGIFWSKLLILYP